MRHLQNNKTFNLRNNRGEYLANSASVAACPDYIFFNMEVINNYPSGYFKPIKNWEHYLIGMCGEVFNTRTGNMKKSHHDNNGYKRVRLINGRNNGATKKIHRLVAEAFIENYSNDLQVNHKNCIKDDNRVANLEMVTQSQNTKHAWDNGRMKLTKRDKMGLFTSNN